MEEKMAIYEIDFKDLHDRRIEIEAQTPEEAVAKFYAKGKMVQLESYELDGIREEPELLQIAHYNEDSDETDIWILSTDEKSSKLKLISEF